MVMSHYHAQYRFYPWGGPDFGMSEGLLCSLLLALQPHSTVWVPENSLRRRGLLEVSPARPRSFSAVYPVWRGRRPEYPVLYTSFPTDRPRPISDHREPSPA